MVVKELKQHRDLRDQSMRVVARVGQHRFGEKRVRIRAVSAFLCGISRNVAEGAVGIARRQGLMRAFAEAQPNARNEPLRLLVTRVFVGVRTFVGAVAIERFETQRFGACIARAGDDVGVRED